MIIHDGSSKEDDSNQMQDEYHIAQSAEGGGLWNTPTASLQRGKTPPRSILWPSRLGLQNILTASP